jgi:hypothetical protein
MDVILDIEQMDPVEVIRSGTPGAIILGTGRCGSTMLSRILRTHPDILSLSGFFFTLNSARFTRRVLDGAQFWQILADPRPPDTVFLQAGMTIPEILYPYSSSSRFGVESGIPPLLMTTLPHLTEEHEALYDKLQQVIHRFPPATVNVHYVRLFTWLKQYFGRKTIIERSGGSLSMAAEMIELFPSTKFVHIMRDGRACACSMSKHEVFRYIGYIKLVKEELGIDSQLFGEGHGIDSFWEGVPMELLDPGLTRKRSIPLEIFGRMWSEVFLFGTEALLQLPSERVMTLRYENFQTAPGHALLSLTNFINSSLSDEVWVQQAGQMVHARPSVWEQLPPDELASLEASCLPGLEVLELITREGMQSPHLPDLLYRHKTSSVH